MRLDRLHLLNFRCFDELSIAFDPRLTVIVGENGAGKTAILDAIALGFGRYLSKLPGVSGGGTKETDLRIDSGERRMPVLKLVWEATSQDGVPIVWSGIRKRDASISASDIEKVLSTSYLRAFSAAGLQPIYQYATKLVQLDADGDSYFLPVVAYYGTNRAIRDEVQRRRGFKKRFTRFDALAGALDPDSRFRSAFEWFNAMEDEERREKETRRDFDYRHPTLQVVRDAIVRMFPHGFSNPRTATRPLRFVIDRSLPNGASHTLRISQLSDGYRVVVGLVMDLARRMAQANAGDDISVNPLDLPAIVLIDEVDLHLHPEWQQRILQDLRNTFTQTQFIVTTHSPQVLTTVTRANIRRLSFKGDGSSFCDPLSDEILGLESQVALNDVMKVNPIPPVEAARWHADYIAKIEDGTHTDPAGQELRAKLLDLYGPNHAIIRDADRLIRFQEFKLRKKGEPRE